MINILIVDDKPERYAALLDRINAHETSSRYIFRSVTNVQDALEHLRGKRFDILVVDMYLPETAWGEKIEDGGAVLLEYLQEDGDLQLPTYIIGITAAKDVPHRVERLFSAQPWQLLGTATGGSPWEEQLERLIAHAAQNENLIEKVEYGTDVCIITALRFPEFEALGKTELKLGENIPIDATSYATAASLQTSSGELKVIASCCLRMGSTESALLSFKLINRFRPKILVMVGI